MGGNRRFEFQKRRQLSIRTHNETLSVAVRVSNPDRSSVAVDGRDPAQIPSGFREIVGDYARSLGFVQGTAPAVLIAPRVVQAAF